MSEVAQNSPKTGEFLFDIAQLLSYTNEGFFAIFLLIAALQKTLRGMILINHMKKKNIELAVKILIYATFFVPLIVMPRSFIFPFIVPKILVFRTLVAVIAALYGLLWYMDPANYRPRFTPVSIAVLAFVVSFALSTFIGTDPYHSFWDNHERMLGLFTILHYGVYFFVITSMFKRWSEWRQLLWVLLCAGSLVMAVGMIQVANPDFLLNQGSTRVSSTLGNPIYVGGYGLFLAFVAGLLMIKERNTVWRVIAAILGFLAILGIFFSGTRGSLAGFAGGVVAAAIVYAIFYKENKKVRYGSLGGVLAIVLITIILFALRDNPVVLKIPGVDRLVTTTFESVKQSARWIAWEIAWKSFKERPVFGWGPNNFFYAFNEHYNPRSLDFGYGETWFDNAHNIIMNTLAVQGAVGLITYLGMFGVSIFVLLKRGNGRRDIHIMALSTGFLLAHLAENISVFENPTSYLTFMVWLAFVNSSLLFGTQNAGSEAKTVVSSARPIGSLAIGITGIVVAAWVFVFNVQPARANMRALATLQILNADPVAAVPYMEETLKFSSPHIDDIRSDVSRTAAGLVQSKFQQIGKENALKIIDIVAAANKENIPLHPLDVRTFMLASDISRLRAQITNSGQDVLDSEHYLEEALRLSPGRQQIVYALSDLKMALGDSATAEKLLQDAVAANPRISETYVRLAYLYFYLQMYPKALDTIAQAHLHNIVFNDAEQGLLNQILASSTAATATPPAKNKKK